MNGLGRLLALGALSGDEARRHADDEWRALHRRPDVPPLPATRWPPWPTTATGSTNRSGSAVLWPASRATETEPAVTDWAARPLIRCSPSRQGR